MLAQPVLGGAFRLRDSYRQRSDRWDGNVTQAWMAGTSPAMTRRRKSNSALIVIPAQAGIHASPVGACAAVGPGLRRDDDIGFQSGRLARKFETARLKASGWSRLAA